MKNRVLIVGGESLIGRSLISFCNAYHQPWVATSRRNGPIDDKTLYLELADDPHRWRIPEGIDCAVMCAGVTSLAVCERNPVLSRAVNEDGMVRVIDHLQKRGARIIFLSTSQVFDGKSPFAALDLPQNPVSVYGRQKAMVEKHLMAGEKNTVILRLTKVLHPGTGILSEWIKTLKQNKSITPFTNMVLAPIPLDQVVNTLAKLITGHDSGIFHLSGEEEISYADMGYFLAKKLDISPERITPVHADHALFPKGTFPMHTTLDTTRTRVELGIEGNDIWQVINQVIQEDLISKNEDNV